MSAENHDKSLEVTVQTTRGSKQFTFTKETKVGEVIDQVVKSFGFAPGDRFELVLSTNTSETLKPERPLVSYGISNGTVLILTAIGSGV